MKWYHSEVLPELQVVGAGCGRARAAGSTAHSTAPRGSMAAVHTVAASITFTKKSENYFKYYTQILLNG